MGWLLQLYYLEIFSLWIICSRIFIRPVIGQIYPHVNILYTTVLPYTALCTKGLTTDEQGGIVAAENDCSYPFFFYQMPIMFYWSQFCSNQRFSLLWATLAILSSQSVSGLPHSLGSLLTTGQYSSLLEPLLPFLWRRRTLFSISTWYGRIMCPSKPSQSLMSIYLDQSWESTWG